MTRDKNMRSQESSGRRRRGDYDGGGDRDRGRWLLCDFHVHTAISGGALHAGEVVDLYGEAGFDVIAITDHLLDGESIREEEESDLLELEGEEADADEEFGDLEELEAESVEEIPQEAIEALDEDELEELEDE